MYVTGNQPTPVVRQLERDFGNITVNDPFDGKVEPAMKWMADSTAEEILHFGNADPDRVPTFTAFPIPDVYFTDGTSDLPKLHGRDDGGDRTVQLHEHQQRVRLEPRLLRAGDQQHLARPCRPGCEEHRRRRGEPR